MTAALVKELEPRVFAGKTIRRGKYTCECGATFETALDVSDPVCEDCRAARHRRASDELECRRRAARTLSTVPERFRDAPFGSSALLSRVHPPTLVEKAKGVLDATNVVFLGKDPGVGKTTLAVAVLRAMAERRNKAGRFSTSFEIADSRRQHRLGQGLGEPPGGS